MEKIGITILNGAIVVSSDHTFPTSRTIVHINFLSNPVVKLRCNMESNQLEFTGISTDSQSAIVAPVIALHNLDYVTLANVIQQAIQLAFIIDTPIRFSINNDDDLNLTEDRIHSILNSLTT